MNPIRSRPDAQGIDAIELPEQDSAFLLGELFQHPDYVDTQPPIELEPMQLVPTEEDRVRQVLGPRKVGTQ